MEEALCWRLFSETDCLTVILLHSVFRDREEISKEHADPLEYTTIDDLRRLIEYFLGWSYKFVSPSDVADGLPKGRRYLLLTFDDGYANFLHVVPLLQEYEICATLFAVSRNIQENRCFWWDVLYRNRRKQGVSEQQISEENGKLQILRPEEIERHINMQFGDRAFLPLGDIDRPLSVAELKGLSAEPRVCVGNHTADHANLACCRPEDIESQVQECQRTLGELTGKVPAVISYPFGSVSQDVVDVCRGLGFTVGITTRAKTNRIPEDIRDDRRLGLGRFNPHFHCQHRCQGEAIRRRVVRDQARERFLGRFRARPAMTSTGLSQ